eukprot:scaffold1938_cov399-Prasinococcus_capsulatus_cf.AAC.7
MDPCMRLQSYLWGLGVRQLYQTFKKVSQYRETVKYLVLYFVYSDGFSTISTVGILYAQQEMCLSTLGLYIVALEVPLFALVGSLLFHRLGIYFKWTNKVSTRMASNLSSANMAYVHVSEQPPSVDMCTADSDHGHAVFCGDHTHVGCPWFHQGLRDRLSSSLGGLSAGCFLRACPWELPELQPVPVLGDDPKGARSGVFCSV